MVKDAFASVRISAIHVQFSLIIVILLSMYCYRIIIIIIQMWIKYLVHNKEYFFHKFWLGIDNLVGKQLFS